MSMDIKSWLEQIGLGHHADVFSEHNIDFDILRDLTGEDLKDIGLPLGDRKRLLKSLATLPSVEEPSIARQPSRRELIEENLGADRRQLTVMFCDLAGSTALSAALDPEDLYEIVSAFQRASASVIEKHAGYIARYMGDGILVYFGYPRADELAPERAVRAALELTRTVPALQTGHGVTLHVRVAIATGKVLVGEKIGEGESLEYSVLGETPNLAARLQGVADLDSVVISNDTRELLGELFSFTDLGEFSLKGLDAPVHAWRVDDEVDVESRFEATHSGRPLTPLVGREPELDQLTSAWNDARIGNGRVVLIRGEAGIGKSRLMLALRDRMAEQPHVLLRYFCVSYRSNSVLYPVISQIERAAKFQRNDPADVKLDKLESLLSQSVSDVSSVAPLFADLLSIPSTGRYPPLSLSPERQKQNTLAALEAQLFQIATHQPVLIMFEDLHWVDATTLELLENAIRWIPSAAVLLVMTARPEFTLPSWQAEHVTEINLERFEKVLETDLILRVTGGKQLPDEVVKLIMEKTDGIPLFIEEFTRTVLKSGALAEYEGQYELKGALPERMVPNSLQDSLLARLDHTTLARRVAQIASVIGRRFSPELLASVADLDSETLNEALNELTGMDLLQPLETPLSNDFIFRHALIQDAAYSSLLRRTRRSLHARIGQEIELRYPETAINEPELLAHHYTRAEDRRRAITFWLQAGKNAGDRAAHTTALRHFATALDLLSQLPEDAERDALELSLLVPRGVSLASTQGYATTDVQATYDRAERLCQTLGDAAEVFAVARNVCTFYIVRDELTQARELAQRCVAIAEQDQDPSCLVEAYTALGYVETHRGFLDDGSRLLKNCIDVYREHRDKITPITPQDPGVACGALRAIVLWFLGRTVDAREELEAALALAISLEHPFHLAYVHTYCAMLAELDGDAETAHSHALEAVTLAQDNGFEVWSAVGMIHLGYAKAMRGEADKAVEILEGVINLYSASGARAVMPYFLAALAEAFRRSDRLDDAIATIERAIAHAQEFEHRMYDSMLYRLLGEMVATRAGTSNGPAEESFRKSLEIARKAGARQLELEGLLACHRFGVEPGEHSLRDALKEAVSAFSPQARSSALNEAREILRS